MIKQIVDLFWNSSTVNTDEFSFAIDNIILIGAIFILFPLIGYIKFGNVFSLLNFMLIFVFYFIVRLIKRW